MRTRSARMDATQHTWVFCTVMYIPKILVCVVRKWLIWGCLGFICAWPELPTKLLTSLHMNAFNCRLGHKSTSGINPTASVFKGISAYLSRSITLSNVVVVFFFYPSALQALLEIFDCNTVDSGSPSNPLMVRVTVHPYTTDINMHIFVPASRPWERKSCSVHW